jgi:hypothetical protein
LKKLKECSKTVTIDPRFIIALALRSVSLAIVAAILGAVFFF